MHSPEFMNPEHRPNPHWRQQRIASRKRTVTYPIHCIAPSNLGVLDVQQRRIYTLDRGAASDSRRSLRRFQMELVFVFAVSDERVFSSQTWQAPDVLLVAGRENHTTSIWENNGDVSFRSFETDLHENRAVVVSGVEKEGALFFDCP
eukprot:2108020-Rhodomonas_salina.2